MSDRLIELINLHNQAFPDQKAGPDTTINNARLIDIASGFGSYMRIRTWLQKQIDKKEERDSGPTVNRETKFSGKKDEYEGGATRDSREGKGRYDLISPLFLKRMAKVLEKGAVNHGENNWKKGIPFSRLIDSSLRHISQYNEGLRDEDHIVQAACNLMFLIHFEEEGRKDLEIKHE